MERRLFFWQWLFLLLLFPYYQVFGQSDSLERYTLDSIEIYRLDSEGKNMARSGDFDGALEAFQSMLDYDTEFEDLVYLKEYKGFNNLGILNKRLGRNNEALGLFQQAADVVIRKCGVDCEQLANIYNNIGNIYNGKQDYEQALQYFNYAERVVQINSLTSSIATMVYVNIGNAYYNMEEFRMALNSYLKSAEMKEKLGAGGLDISYANCASAYEAMEILDSARIYYDWAIESKIEQYGDSSYQLISVYNNYSILLNKLNENEKAFSYLSKALELALNKYVNDHPLISESHYFLGEWYYKTDMPDSAVVHYHKAICEAVYNYDDPDLFSNPSLNEDIVSESSLLDALRGKAFAFELLYEQTGNINDLIASLDALDVSNLLTEKMRSSYLGQESKLFIAETSHAGLSKAINTAFSLYMLTDNPEYARRAFTYAEKSKSSVLLASLQEVENKKNLGIPAEVQTLEEDLKSEREILKKKLYEERQREELDTARLGKWQGKLIELNKQLDSINHLIRQDFPEYAAKYDNEVISIADVQSGLENGQALIEYTFTDSAMFIFLIERDLEYFTRIEITDSYRENIIQLGKFLRDNDFANNTYDDYLEYVDVAYALYKYLLQPFEDMIGGKNLIIIPDGELGYIPFEALLTDEADKARMDYRSLPYLIYKFVTNYSYSATLHFENNQRGAVPGRQLLAFAPSYDNVGQIRADKFPTFRNYSDVLVPLRFIKEEIENISNIMESDKFEGFAATEKTFREKAPDYDILHLAMHTLINDDNPMYSQLVFSLNNDTIEENDGLLNTFELFNIDLSARMAVLSACNTGYGQLRKGEGVMSLARGFIFAGVPSIIMTLWAVEDQSGSVLMSSFYENLVDGLEIDVALRESKLKYLKTADQLSAHPYLWSGYVSIGATDPLNARGLSLTSILIYGFAALLLIVPVILLARRKKKA